MKDDQSCVGNEASAEILTFHTRPISGSILNRIILELTLAAGRIGSFVTRHRGWIQGIAGTIALALGFWGWMIEKPPADFSGVVDNLFRTAQLITLQFPT